jgi:HAD superfamily hydrolase (TIGR01509 family)
VKTSRGDRPLAEQSTSLVIFDCDGVLVDSEELQIRALLDVAAPLGFEMPLETAVERFRGAKMADVVNAIEGRIGVATPVDFVADVRAHQAEVFARELRAVDGIHDALGRLPVPRCVASSGPLEKIRNSLTITGLLDAFEDRIFSAYEIGHWKPEPDLFLHAAERMGANPKDSVVVEDSVLGVQAGVAAGMRVLGFAEGARAVALAAAGAEVFGAMRHLPALVLRARGARLRT